MSENFYRKGKRTIACRECQRLKLKCNRSWPCDSCIKRGVQDVCPDGVLPTTRRQRSNLIDASRLHEVNLRMSGRIRELESALATLQSGVSPKPHPLLKDELLTLGDPLDVPPLLEGVKLKTPSKPASIDETIEAFGTLAIGVNGRTIFHSQAVSTDYLVEPSWITRTKERSVAEAMSLTPEIISLSSLFPFGDPHTSFSDVKPQILSFLPPVDKAARLIENYYDHFSWWLNPISRQQFDQEIFPILTISPNLVSADRLSLLFMMLAIGVFQDIENPVNLTSSDILWQLSRAAFCLEPLLDVSTTYTIQTLQLMTAYLHVTLRQKAEHQWVIMGLTARMIHSSGLHYDGEHWLKDIKNDIVVEQRRKIFNECLVYDAMMSFAMGRPPAFSLAHVQTKLPVDDEKFTTEAGVEECGLSNWKYRYTKECLYPVMDEAFGAKPPSYNTILRLDRKLREFPIPSHLLYPGLGGQPEESNLNKATFRKWMQRAYLFGLRETSLLYLHRSYFAQALLDHPENPFEDKYAASVLAAFRSASRIIAGVRDISHRYMTVVSRTWWFWQNLFSAGIVLAMFVIRAPKCKMAKSALEGLREACDLLQNRVLACRAAHPRRLIERLRDSAEIAFKTGSPVPTTCGLGMMDEDEVIIFAPSPRTVLHGELHHFTPSLAGRCPLQLASSNWGDAHPELMQTFNFFDEAGASVITVDNSVNGEDQTTALSTENMQQQQLASTVVHWNQDGAETQWEGFLDHFSS
ncbi:hypothetical protein K439DRAFT_131977 [Ramaria rubella]|nr:hypothetical protein K439DRAFT_131977 [Ramaria rubella]